MVHPAKPPREDPTTQLISYLVRDERAVSIGFEAVSVNPALEWAQNLSIHEPMGWFPVLDLRTPPHREVVQPQRVIDECAGPKRLGGNPPDTEMEKRWCNCSRLWAVAKKG